MIFNEVEDIVVEEVVSLKFFVMLSVPAIKVGTMKSKMILWRQE
jgi:hypothetical protein